MGNPTGYLCAQTSFSDLLRERSEPSAGMWKALGQMSEYSSAEMRLLDARSALDAPEQNRLGARSEWSASDSRILVTRSEFSASEQRILESRSVSDGAQVLRLHRYATPDPGLTRRDRLVDSAVLSVVLRQSEISPEDKRRLFRGFAWASFKTKIWRHSRDAQQRAMEKRSVPDPTWLRSFRARSAD